MMISYMAQWSGVILTAAIFFLLAYLVRKDARRRRSFLQQDLWCVVIRSFGKTHVLAVRENMIDCKRFIQSYILREAGVTKMDDLPEESLSAFSNDSKKWKKGNVMIWIEKVGSTIDF